MKLICTCQYCSKQSDGENMSVEINFLNGHIYFMCQYCNKMNDMEVVKKTPALPKIKKIWNK